MEDFKFNFEQRLNAPRCSLCWRPMLYETEGDYWVCRFLPCKKGLIPGERRKEIERRFQKQSEKERSQIEKQEERKAEVFSKKIEKLAKRNPKKR